MIEQHRTIMTEEVLKYLDIKPQGIYLDCTLGDGGHTLAIAQSGGRVIAIDQDKDALERSYVRLSKDFAVSKQKTLDWKDIVFAWSSFGKLDSVLRELEIKELDGVIFDLGVSTLQLMDPERGFSFSKPAALDMRMDRESMAVTAADLVNGLSERELSSLFLELGGETFAKPIAKAIVLNRAKHPIKTTEELAQLVSRTKTYRSKIHPATKVFQALRMAVNSERMVLRQALPLAFDALKSGGTMVVLSFHDGEDTIVKDFFISMVLSGKARELTDALKPSEQEVDANRRSRSTKLRAIKKI